ncbi:hypothetical protein KY284_006426 [Solanum tuberosum]|nr:hypothetical protein KY284_006426 [Solanum tuberosum]
MMLSWSFRMISHTGTETRPGLPRGARRRGEIRRSTKERQKRRQLSGSLPTLRCESMGSEQD